MEHKMSEKYNPDNWIFAISGALFTLIMAGIRWYLMDLKTQLTSLHKKVDKLDEKWGDEVNRINKRIDTHIEKGD